MGFALYQAGPLGTPASPDCAGRLVLSGAEQDPAALGPADVVYIPLFAGSAAQPGPFPPEPLPDYAEHLAFLREVAPRVMGICTGNHGPELSYKHLGWEAAANIGRMMAFVELTAPMITEAGARPFYGTIDWDFLHDVYGPGARGLLETVNRYGGIQCVFTGFTLCPGCYMQPGVKHFQGAQERLIRGNDRDFSRLRRYLAAGECWSGIGGRPGLEAGNAEKLDMKKPLARYSRI